VSKSDIKCIFSKPRGVPCKMEQLVAISCKLFTSNWILFKHKDFFAKGDALVHYPMDQVYGPSLCTGHGMRGASP
jgi:hypothetical protein